MNHEKLDKPSVLYKYSSFQDWSLNYLRGDSLKFSSRTEFNDPFDSRPAAQIDLSSEEGLRHFKPLLSHLTPALRLRALGEARNRNRSPRQSGDLSMDEFLDGIGILSLSENWNNPLMWAHYANMHAGFCVGFHSSLDTFNYAEPVRYQKLLPIIRRPSDDGETLIQKTFFTKSEDWKYEKEWRVVKNKASGDEMDLYNLVRNGSKENSAIRAILEQRGHGIYKFDTAAIESITVGMRMANDRALILANIAKSLKIPIYRIGPPKLTYDLERTRLRS